MKLYWWSSLVKLYIHMPLLMTLKQSIEKERKHGALRPQKPLRLIRDGEVGGSGAAGGGGGSGICISKF